MPRIYASNEAHDMEWGAVDFVNGVAAVPADTDVSYYEALEYAIDASKHERNLLDELTPAQLRALCAYIGLAIDQGAVADTKHELIRAIEGEVSSKYIAALTVTSSAGTEAGDTKIAITTPGDYVYKYKTAATNAPSLLYMDEPDSTWIALTTPAGEDLTPAAEHDKIAVVRVNAAGAVTGIGSADITVKV